MLGAAPGGAPEEGRAGVRSGAPPATLGLLGRPTTAARVHLYHHACLPLARLRALPGVTEYYYDFVRAHPARDLPRPGHAVGRVDLVGDALRFDLDACDFERADCCRCGRADACERCWPLVRRAAELVSALVRDTLRLGRVAWFYSGARGAHGFVFACRALTAETRAAVARELRRMGAFIDAPCTTSVAHKMRAPWSCHGGGHVNLYLGAPSAAAAAWEWSRLRAASDVHHVLSDLHSLRENLQLFDHDEGSAV